MAVLFNGNNWRNLFFGKGGGKGKGDGKGDPNDIYKPIEGQRVLSFIDMSNRVQHLCRAHESERADKEEETKQEKADERMKQILAQQYGITLPTGKGKGPGKGSHSKPPKRRKVAAAGAIDDLSATGDDEDDPQHIDALEHKEVAMSAKTIRLSAPRNP